MATTQNAYRRKTFKVVHPLDDAREQKRETEGLGLYQNDPVSKNLPHGASGLPRPDDAHAGLPRR